MIDSKSKVQLVEYNPSNVKVDFRCGNNRFSDDVWDFKGYIPEKNWNDAKYKLNFKLYDEWLPIKETLKWYAVSEILMNSYSSVRRKLDAFNQLRKYLLLNSDIESFKDFTREVLQDYFHFLLSAKNEKGEELSPVSRKKSAQVVKELLIRGGVKGWSVPEDTSYIEHLYQTQIIENKKIKEGTKFGPSKKVLPEEEAVEQLINTAEKELYGSDPLTASSILLTSQLGLRISECISIETGCLSSIGGKVHITYTTSKTGKTPEKVTKPANKLVIKAIDRLEEYAKPLREESGKPNLFLTRNRSKKGTPVCIASYSNWSKNRINPFIKKHNLTDSKGKLLKLSHHYFRHIFATYALKGGMSITDVAEIMNHASIMMTDTYDHTKGQKQKAIKEILTGETPITSTNKIVLESIEGDENPFKGLATDQVEKMRKALKIELLPHGMCLHHPMRGEPCPQDGVCLGCNNFIASAKHIPVYELRLNKVKEELENLNNDKSIYTSKLNYQRNKLEGYINELNQKLANKDYQKAMNEVAVGKVE